MFNPNLFTLLSDKKRLRNMEEIDYNYLIMVRDYHLRKPRGKQLREPDGTILPLILIECEI